MVEVLDYGFGIHAIDAGYERPNLASIHFMIDSGAAAVIDTGTNYSVPRTLEALARKNIAPEQVEYVILTHIHLDHAGGAGELMARCPNATLTVHPRGARHMADPSKLWAATMEVYGPNKAREVYGEILPIPKERIIETSHDAEITLGERTLRFIDTPGHARHHVCIVDSKSGHVFAGDTFGISYRELDQDGRNFIIPTSSPVQFDPEPYHRSIDLIASYKPDRVYLTHFSQVHDAPRLAGRLHDLVDQHAALGLHYKDAGTEREALLTEGVTRIVLDEAERQGLRFPRDYVLEVMGVDIGLNAQGLISWLDSMR